MNMISQLRARIQEAGLTILTADEYNQLQREWITRTGAEDMVAAERDRGENACNGWIGDCGDFGLVIVREIRRRATHANTTNDRR